MKREEVTVVRIYLTEGSVQLESLMKRLRDWEKVRGVTIFRGVSGFGDSGQLHSGRFVDLALDLPVVVEFFDTPERVEEILSHLDGTIKPGHLVSWSAMVSA